MKNIALSLIVAITLSLALTGATQAADCYADYKAKQDKPLRLHYGVAQVTTCNKAAARSELEPRLAARGWTLLNVVSVFDTSGLAERKESAGQFFLRF